MDLPLSLAIIITIVAIIFSGLFSGTEIAFVQSSKVRMEINAASGGIVDRIIRGFSRHEDMFISTLLVGNNVVLVIYGISLSAIINPLLEQWLPNDAMVLIVNTVFSTGIILLTGEFLPKTTFRINPNFMMRLLALPLYLIYLTLYPISWFVSVISKGLMKLFGLDTVAQPDAKLTIDELDTYLQQSVHDNPDNSETVENEVKIFRRAVDFKDTEIVECMTPRNEIVSVPLEGTTLEQLRQVFIDTGFSKVVVYSDDIDDVVGYIHVSELLNADTDWRRHIKPVIFTPETMLANKMMRRMMAEKKSMAIIVDEFGGTSGLATLEDIVEEIFGEIEDEHDRTRIVARRIGVGSFIFSGRAEISMINEEFGLSIRENEEEYHTLAGYILVNLEALPKQGDEFTIGNLKFNIKKMSTTRIELIKVTLTDK